MGNEFISGLCHILIRHKVNQFSHIPTCIMGLVLLPAIYGYCEGSDKGNVHAVL